MARHAIQAQERSAASRRTAASRRSANPSDALALDPVIHERVRLGIISALAVNDTLSFGDLKKLLETTDGNLSVHARKLEDAGYLQCKKFFQGRTPRTEYSLTPSGKKALEKYLEQMEGIIRGARNS